MNNTRKTIVAIGLMSGIAIWFGLFAIAFNLSGRDYWTALLLPLGVEAIVMYLIGWTCSREWLSGATAIVLPVAVGNMTCLSMVNAEGKGIEWAYVVTLLLVVGVAFASGFVGARMPSMMGRNGEER